MSSLKELAKLLGVSISTVSKALNNADDISENTKIRVRELAEAMNYQPNKMGAGLRNKKSKTIGVIIPDILNSFFAEVLFGIEKQCSKKGYDTLVCISNEMTKKEAEKVRLLKSGSVDGFLISLAAQTLKNGDINHIKNNIDPQKLVLFDRLSDQINCDRVGVDDQKITYQVTKQLIEKGYKKIAFLSSINNLNLGKDRKKGYLKALSEYSIAKENIMELSLESRAAMHKKLVDWIQKNPADAVIAADNSSGIMFQNCLLTQNLRKAKKVTVIGFSNDKNALLTFPKMNYIDQNASMIGEKAAELLIKRLESNSKELPFVDVKIDAKVNFFE
ncbi:MAG: LacI family transcriptional regulator [Flavobacteriaceae bacterium]|nr:LacI family transcriptional regulator [Flavobacteriaceae bacterium]